MIPTLRVRGQGAGIIVSYNRRYGNKILRSKIKIFKQRFIEKMWSAGERNGKPLQYSCLENPMNSMKREKDRILKEKSPGWWVCSMLLEISGEITPGRIKG